MLKGFKHAVSCDCGENIQYCDSLNDAETLENNSNIMGCCDSKLQYKGLQPYYKSILSVPQPQSVIITEGTKKNSTINNLIDIGPKGKITNVQMIPRLKELIDKNDIETVKILKNTYEDVYNKSINRLPKKYKDFLENLN